MASGQGSSARRPPPLGLVGLRRATFTPPLGQRNLQPVVPPDNSVRRVGLMRPHGSSLVGGINNIFSGASMAGTSSGSGAGTSSGSGAGTANGSRSEPLQAVRRVGLSRRRQLSRASSIVTADPPLNLGGGFRIDTSSAFFQHGRSSGMGGNMDGIGSSSFVQPESSDQGERRSFGVENNASGQGYRGLEYNPNFENADEYPPSQQHVQANPPPAIDLNVMTKNKGHIQKIMFISAMARPRYDAEGNCIFDGKIGVWAYVEWVQAQKKSANREKGEWELKPCTDVDKAKSREYLVKFVLPAIKAKWPASDRYKTVFIQQDNARTHIQPDDPVFLTEAARGGWDIRMVFQPPNSPDTNILDLGWFASIQSMFQKKMPKTLPEILSKVNQSLAEYPHEKLNRIFLSHQACMREIIRRKGTIHYDVPHLKKKVLERQGKLPIRLTIDKEYVDAAIEWLNANHVV